MNHTLKNWPHSHHFLSVFVVALSLLLTREGFAEAQAPTDGESTEAPAVPSDVPDTLSAKSDSQEPAVMSANVVPVIDREDMLMRFTAQGACIESVQLKAFRERLN